VATPFRKSPRLAKLADGMGISMTQIENELDRRSIVLSWIQSKGIRNFKELSPILELYVARPEEVFKTASNELEAKGIAVAEILGDYKPGVQAP